MLLAGVEEPEQASPAPPANKTCIHHATASSWVAADTSPEAKQGATSGSDYAYVHSFSRALCMETFAAWMLQNM